MRAFPLSTHPSRRLAGFVALAMLSLGGCRREDAAPAGSVPAIMEASVALRIPPPDSFVRVDYAKREINLVILVVGETADSYLHALHQKTAPDADDLFQGSGISRLSYLPLSLGDIRGFRTNFHLYSIGPQESSPPPVEPYAERACALIVVGRGLADGEANARRARRKKPDIPVAFLGYEEAARRWNEGGDRKPVFEGAMADDAYFPALKATAKACLMDLRDETPH